MPLQASDRAESSAILVGQPDDEPVKSVDCCRTSNAIPGLGVRLLNRTTRSVALTEAGARLVMRLRPDLAERRAGHGAHRPGGDLGVEGGVVELGVAEQDLDHPDIGAVLQEVGGEAVAQSVRADALGDAGGPCGLDDDPAELPGTDRLEGVLAGEQPAVTQHHALLAAGPPPLAQQGQQIRREQGVAVPVALALFDPDRRGRDEVPRTSGSQPPRAADARRGAVSSRRVHAKLGLSSLASHRPMTVVTAIYIIVKH